MNIDININELLFVRLFFNKELDDLLEFIVEFDLRFLVI